MTAPLMPYVPTQDRSSLRPGMEEIDVDYPTNDNHL